MLMWPIKKNLIADTSSEKEAWIRNIDIQLAAKICIGHVDARRVYEEQSIRYVQPQRSSAAEEDPSEKPKACWP